MTFLKLLRGAALLLVAVVMACRMAEAQALRAGFAHSDITPEIRDDRPVWLAGYGPGRRATGVHDPLFTRCVVLQTGAEKIAIVSVDAIGLQLPEVERIRAGLADYRYVLVTSTHNHEAPDVIGIWGATPLHRGVDDEYNQLLINRSIAAVRMAEKTMQDVTVMFGSAEDPSLVNDSRLPEVKDGVIRVLQFRDLYSQAIVGLLVQWNSHPEAMGSRNTLITADFPSATIQWLTDKYGCPVVYCSGAVGGLMAPPRNRIFNAQGELLHEGDFEYMRIYGEEVAKLADRGVIAGEPIRLTPFQVSAVRIGMPVTNPLYRAARALGVVRRAGRVWMGDPLLLGEPVRLGNANEPTAVETEVAFLRLGELQLVCIPGEIYPELVYGGFQEPPDPAVDFPDAPLEPTVVSLMTGPRWMLFGLANDELGYLIPRRQWDQQLPYAYGRKRSQYGEVNSCGPDSAPVIMDALARAVREASSVTPMPVQVAP